MKGLLTYKQINKPTGSHDLLAGGNNSISTVLCQKGLSDIFGHFLLFRDYDTTANNTFPVNFFRSYLCLEMMFFDV